MSDVADAVGLHRGLVYLHFSSKDALVEALIVRELSRYGETWSHHLETDPLGGSVASVYRSVVHALKQVPLMAAIFSQDEQTFGKYLRKPGNLIATHGSLKFQEVFENHPLNHPTVKPLNDIQSLLWQNTAKHSSKVGNEHCFTGVFCHF
jgi:AcrR family transcriptional regulator